MLKQRLQVRRPWHLRNQVPLKLAITPVTGIGTDVGLVQARDRGPAVLGNELLDMMVRCGFCRGFMAITRFGDPRPDLLVRNGYGRQLRHALWTLASGYDLYDMITVLLELLEKDRESQRCRGMDICNRRMPRPFSARRRIARRTISEAPMCF